MIYSQWDPATGLYDYFETDQAPSGLNDDLPTPPLPRAHPIGVPSVEAGRPIPDGSVHIGRGELAEGSIAPPGRGPGSLGALALPSWLAPAALGAAVGAAAMWLWRRR